MKRKIILIATLLAFKTAASQAWDETGHLFIDTIAAERLRPEVAREIKALLPFLDTRFNQRGPYNMITAGLWMDDMRGLGKAAPWSRWHYIDVPCAGDSFVEPPPPHALSGLDQAMAVLRSKTAEPKARAEALAQIIHLVGDIHQPMHAADRNDRGGNNVPIAFTVDSPHLPPTTLHVFWDEAYGYDGSGEKILDVCPRLTRFNAVTASELPVGEAIFALAKTLKIRSAPVSQHPWREWARETHRIACASGWPKEWDNEDKTLPLELTPAFVHAAHEIALRQIAKAGVRLADLLNEALANP